MGLVYEFSDFKDILKEILQETGLTQAEFAASINVKQGQVSEWLKGKTKPGYDTIKQMCVALNVSADYLLGLKLERK